MGHSLEVYYRLPAPLRSGGYRVEVTGYNSGDDAHISAELRSRSDGAADVTLATLDGPPPPKATGVGARTWISSTACLNAQPGDALVLRVNYLSGSSLFGSIATRLTIP